MTSEPNSSTDPKAAIGGFLSSVWGKTLSILAAITMVGGIAAEGLSIFRNWQDSQIAANKILESKAEQCAKRARYVVDFVPMNQWGAANAAIDRDCNPNYAERTKKCAAKFTTLLAQARDLDSLLAEVKSYKTDCDFSDEQRTAVMARMAEVTPKLKPAEAPTPPVAPPAQLTTGTVAAPNAVPAPASLISTPQPPPPSKPVSFKTFDNADMMGGDIQFIKDINLDDCTAACRSDPKCRAYSYDKWNRSCYPKSEMHSLTLTARSLTAIRDDQPEPARSTIEVGIEHFHNRAFARQEQPKKLVSTADACEAGCQSADWCVAYTFFKQSRECQMFKSTGVYNPEAGAESGAKTQAE